MHGAALHLVAVAPDLDHRRAEVGRQLVQRVDQVPRIGVLPDGQVRVRPRRGLAPRQRRQARRPPRRLQQQPDLVGQGLVLPPGEGLHPFRPGLQDRQVPLDLGGPVQGEARRPGMSAGQGPGRLPGLRRRRLDLADHRSEQVLHPHLPGLAALHDAGLVQQPHLHLVASELPYRIPQRRRPSGPDRVQSAPAHPGRADHRDLRMIARPGVGRVEVEEVVPVVRRREGAHQHPFLSGGAGLGRRRALGRQVVPAPHVAGGDGAALEGELPGRQVPLARDHLQAAVLVQVRHQRRVDAAVLLGHGGQDLPRGIDHVQPRAPLVRRVPPHADHHLLHPVAVQIGHRRREEDPPAAELGAPEGFAGEAHARHQGRLARDDQVVEAVALQVAGDQPQVSEVARLRLDPGHGARGAVQPHHEVAHAVQEVDLGAAVAVPVHDQRPVAAEDGLAGREVRLPEQPARARQGQDPGVAAKDDLVPAVAVQVRGHRRRGQPPAGAELPQHPSLAVQTPHPAGLGGDDDLGAAVPVHVARGGEHAEVDGPEPRPAPEHPAAAVEGEDLPVAGLDHDLGSPLAVQIHHYRRPDALPGPLHLPGHLGQADQRRPPHLPALRVQPQQVGALTHQDALDRRHRRVGNGTAQARGLVAPLLLRRRPRRRPLGRDRGQPPDQRQDRDRCA